MPDDALQQTTPDIQAAADKIKADVDGLIAGGVLPPATIQAIVATIDSEVAALAALIPTSAPAPPPVALTLANFQVSASGSTVIASVSCSADVVNLTLSEGGKKVAPDAKPINGNAVWTLSNVTAGNHTYGAQGWNVPAGQKGKSTPTATDRITVGSNPNPNPPPPPPAPPPTTGSGKVNAAPTGPSGSFEVIMADGFGGSQISDLWCPNRGGTTANANADKPGDNGNEIEVFNGSQVQITQNGCELVAQRLNGLPNGKLIRSGTIRSQPGSAVKGFEMSIATGGKWVVEAVITNPDATGGGNDPGWWLVGSHWDQEFDMFEWWDGWKNPGQNPDTYQGTINTWIVNGSVHGQRANHGVPAWYDGQPHRWTTLFDDDARLVTTYIDGNHVGWADLPYPSGVPGTPQWLIASHAYRFQAPQFHVGDVRKMTMRSVAVYRDTAHVGKGYQGGGIASGTTVS